MGRAAVSEQAEIVAWPDFGAFVSSLLAKGYARNPCRPESCHDKSEHAHLKTPEGQDVMVWADGTASHFDLSQPAKYICPSYARRRRAGEGKRTWR
jgi:hypothetical protein